MSFIKKLLQIFHKEWWVKRKKSLPEKIGEVKKSHRILSQAEIDWWRSVQKRRRREEIARQSRLSQRRMK